PARQELAFAQTASRPGKNHPVSGLPIIQIWPKKWSTPLFRIQPGDSSAGGVRMVFDFFPNLSHKEKVYGRKPS
ncbi:MAG: hypothetical protein ACLFQY_18530, partial [Desulfococcaceae bacterium]